MPQIKRYLYLFFAKMGRIKLRLLLFRVFATIGLIFCVLGGLCGHYIYKIHNEIYNKTQKEQGLAQRVHNVELQVLELVRALGVYLHSSGSVAQKDSLHASKRIFLQALKDYESNTNHVSRKQDVEQVLKEGHTIDKNIDEFVFLQSDINMTLASVEQAVNHLQDILKQEKSSIDSDMPSYSEYVKLILRLESFAESIFSLVVHHMIKGHQGFYEGIYDVERDYDALLDAEQSVYTSLPLRTQQALDHGFSALVEASYRLVKLQDSKLKLMSQFQESSSLFLTFLKQRILIQVDMRNRELQSNIDRDLLVLLCVYMMFCLIMVVLGFLFYFFITRVVAKPITILTRDVQNVAETGDFSTTIEYRKESCQEVTELVDSFVYMIRTIHEKESLLSRSIENMEDAFFLCQVNVEQEHLILVECNSAAEFLFQIIKTESVGQNVSEIVPCFKEEELVERAWIVYHSGQSVFLNKVPFMRDGIDCMAELTMYQVENGVALIFRDITENIVLEQQLVHSEKLIAVGEMAAGVAHEIGNPLTAVNSIVQFLRKDETDEDKQKDLEVIDENIQRIRRSLQDLVEFSRTSKDEKSIFSISEALNNVVHLMRYHQKLKNIEIKFNGLSVDDKINADQQQVEQVFLNIIINAADAIEEYLQAEQGSSRKGLIDIGVERHNGNVMVKLRDNGVGIECVDTLKIFDPFYTTKKKVEGSGTGLGMTLVKNTVERYHGHIRILSEKHQGTTVELTFPHVKG